MLGVTDHIAYNETLQCIVSLILQIPSAVEQPVNLIDHKPVLNPDFN